MAAFFNIPPVISLGFPDASQGKPGNFIRGEENKEERKMRTITDTGTETISALFFAQVRQLTLGRAGVSQEQARRWENGRNRL